MFTTAPQFSEQTDASFICCSICICAITTTLAICANITVLVGLNHTRLIDLEPFCPHNYWDGSLTLFFLRIVIFVFVGIVGAGAKGAAKDPKHTRFAVITVLVALVTILSLTITDTVITSQAISALNCSVALKANRDTDALLIVGGSMFVALDWISCIGVFATTCLVCRASAQVMSE